jgi:hypothetical protein
VSLPTLGESVRPVTYAAIVEYDESRSRWDARETVHVARHALERMTRGGAVRWDSGDPTLRDRVLGESWHYLGDRGSSGQVYAYRRTRSIRVNLHGRPQAGEGTITISPITTGRLAATLVPRDGSVVELRAPGHLVREIDPAAVKRQFGNEDIFTLRLRGLEDYEERRDIHLQLADRIADPSIL